MAPAQTEIDLRSWGLLLFLSVLWGGSFLFVGIAVKDLSPLVIVMVRVVIAAAALLPIHMIFKGSLPRDSRSWITFAVMSFFNNIIPFTLLATGQTMIASGLASVINATTPLFGAAFLALAGADRLVPRKAAGLLAGVAGVVVLKGNPGIGLGDQGLGIMLCLGAAASYGVASLWAKKRLKGVPALTMATGQLVCSSVAMVALAFTFDSPTALLQASATTWGVLLGLALLATSLAYIVFFRIVDRSGAANVMLVTMMIPVSAIAMGYVVLSETLELREIAGTLIIIAALVIIDGRVLGWFKPSRQG